MRLTRLTHLGRFIGHLAGSRHVVDRSASVNGWESLAVFLSGVVAGSVNAVVGAGTLVTFSTLITVGIPPLTANVSNTVGLAAGSVASSVGYRPELRQQRARLRWLLPASVLGGLTGAGLLLVLPDKTFDAVVPVLVLTGVVLVFVQPRLAARLETPHDVSNRGSGWVWLGVFVTGVYGGYFGAAQGVLLIALLGTLVDAHLQRVNALKNALAAAVNLVAAAVFIAVGSVDWTVALLLVVGSMIGGYFGAHYGRRLPATLLRWFIALVGLVAVVLLVVR
ncbi:MAG: sulfite exporter TauE/SafE family protein [Candidatus Nanopelagicales bacterium]